VTHTIDYKGFYLAFRDISRLVHSSTSVQEVIDLAVWKTNELLDAKGTLLRIHNLETNNFEVTAACGIARQYLGKGPVSSEQIRADLNYSDSVRIFNDIWQAPRVALPQQAWGEGVRMILDCPLRHDNDILGLIRVYLAEAREFQQAELDFVISLGEQCACALNKARLIENQQSRYNHLVLQTEKLSALGRMAAGIAHEINNPLGGILLYSSNMFKKTDDGDPRKKGLEIIIRETTRCKGIIQELLEFSRYKAPNKQLLNLNDTLRKALSILDNEFMLRHIKVTKTLAHDLEDILLDGNQMEQVFINLLLNAAQAIDKQGQIRIETRMDADRDLEIVEIADDGCGIAPEEAGKLFEPFYSTKSTGTGLGLAVSYGIVRNHEGQIRVASQLNEGTCFTIELPLDRPAPSEPQKQGNA
jgi:signal transduction histidine kinase